MDSSNNYELRIERLEHLSSFAAARWELLALPAVRDLTRGCGRGRFVVIYEGEQADPDAWCRLLHEAGFPAEPIGQADDSDTAA